MNGPSHRVAALAAWFAAAPALHVIHPGHLAAGAVIAGACGHGRLSPDADHSAFPVLARLVPGGHRGILHTPWLPALAIWAAPQFGAYSWQVLAVAVAWASHVAADFPFGRIPLFPGRRGWIRAGFRFKTGGPAERWVCVPVLTLAAVWCAVAAFTGHDPTGPVRALLS